MSVVFVDVETTGLDPERAEVWEIALIAEDGAEHLWYLRPDSLDGASPDALRVSRYYERTNIVRWDEPVAVAWKVAQLTEGRHLVGAVPSFDAAFLARLLRRHDLVPAWHYRLVDVEALAAGRLQVPPPWDVAELSRRLGVSDDAESRHTALGDARWARDLYRAVLGLGTSPQGGAA